MTELSFAKNFLATLDSKTIKLQADHAADPKTFEPKGAYTLPRTSQPMRRRDASTSTPSTPSTITVTLKSLRNPPLSLTLPSQELNTSIMTLKTAVSKAVRAKGTEGIKVLYNKKPCADSKTVKDVLGSDEPIPEEVEFSIMVMGGAATAAGTGDGEKDVEGKAVEGGDKMDVDTPPVAEGSGEVLESEEFWSDLKGFLSQRLKDDGKATEVVEVFRAGWKGKSGGGGTWKWGGMKGWKS
ncbi:MAG: hypothetical protein Q9195_006165 [Heterodermia aff. obscurata]